MINTKHQVLHISERNPTGTLVWIVSLKDLSQVKMQNSETQQKKARIWKLFFNEKN